MQVLPSVTLIIYKFVLFVYKLHCLISQSTWKFDQNGTNTICYQYPRLQPLIAEKALDILAEPQSQPKCKKTYSNSSIIFALKSRSLPAFSALLQSAQPALVHELGKKLVVNSNSTPSHVFKQNRL